MEIEVLHGFGENESELNGRFGNWVKSKAKAVGNAAKKVGQAAKQASTYVKKVGDKIGDTKVAQFAKKHKDKIMLAVDIASTFIPVAGQAMKAVQIAKLGAKALKAAKLAKAGFKAVKAVKKVSQVVKTVNKVKKVADAVNKVKKVANAVNKVKKVADAVNKVKKVANAVNKVKKVANTVNKVKGTVKKVKKATNAINKVKGTVKKVQKITKNPLVKGVQTVVQKNKKRIANKVLQAQEAGIPAATILSDLTEKLINTGVTPEVAEQTAEKTIDFANGGQSVADSVAEKIEELKEAGVPEEQIKEDLAEKIEEAGVPEEVAEQAAEQALENSEILAQEKAVEDVSDKIEELKEAGVDDEQIKDDLAEKMVEEGMPEEVAEQAAEEMVEQVQPEEEAVDGLGYVAIAKILIPLLVSNSDKILEYAKMYGAEAVSFAKKIKTDYDSGKTLSWIWDKYNKGGYEKKKNRLNPNRNPKLQPLRFCQHPNQQTKSI